MKKIITNIAYVISEINKPQGKYSSKRFWGGVVITNCIVLTHTNPTAKELIVGTLIYGCALVGLGILDGMKKKDKVDEKC